MIGREFSYDLLVKVSSLGDEELREALGEVRGVFVAQSIKPQARVLAEARGFRWVEVDYDGRPSGLGWLPDGRLLFVSMLDRRVMRREPDGTIVEFYIDASDSGGKTRSWPNAAAGIESTEAEIRWPAIWGKTSPRNRT